MKQLIRVLIADDHKVVREGLKAFLAPTAGLEIVGEAVNGLEAVAMAAELQPDVILLDLLMPELDGIGAARQIGKINPQIKMIIITSYVEEANVIMAIKAGVVGYLLKDSSPEEIENAIHNVFEGGTAFPAKITSMMVRELNRPEKEAVKESGLTEREVEILKLMALGMSNKEIARDLLLSVWTIRTYVTGILDKLQVENRTQATLFAIREGLVKIDK